MEALVILIGVSIVIRQIDRWWFSPARNPFNSRPIESMSQIRSLQKERANNLTPTILVCSTWAEIAAWCFLLVPAGPALYLPLATIVALRFRQLQEITHFAVHGVLVRKLWFGNFLAEVGFQIPLGLMTISIRRKIHVREHHPNATIVGIDPNIQTLARAGLRLGVNATRFVLALLYPLTPPGIVNELRTCATAGTARSRVLDSIVRKSVPVAIGLGLFLIFGWPGATFGYILPRFVIYPAFAWLSLLIEHRWFKRGQPTGIPAVDEASRCLRLYRGRPIVLAIARATWLPYGDAFHFAHSIHPAVRWNYLKELDRQLVTDVAEFKSVMLGRESVLATLYMEASHESERKRILVPPAAVARRNAGGDARSSP